MARALRRPPGVSEDKTFRAHEYFFQDLYAILGLVGEVTVDVGSIAAGGSATFTVEVAGARVNKGMGVLVGVPAAFPPALTPWGYVSADDQVTVVFVNATAGAIDPPAATYSVRVLA